MCVDVGCDSRSKCIFRRKTGSAIGKFGWDCGIEWCFSAMLSQVFSAWTSKTCTWQITFKSAGILFSKTLLTPFAMTIHCKTWSFIMPLSSSGREGNGGREGERERALDNTMELNMECLKSVNAFNWLILFHHFWKTWFLYDAITKSNWKFTESVGETFEYIWLVVLIRPK